MLSPEQIHKQPLVLTRKSEILMANIAVKDTYGDQHPLSQSLEKGLDSLDWSYPEKVIEGHERDLVLHALTERASRLPENPDKPTPDETWKQKQAAMILGIHFASLMEPVLTVDMIVTGLIEHNPEVEHQISASIPVFIDA